MTGPVTVYFGGKRALVPSGATLLEALQSFDADDAAKVRNGERIFTDSRGLPTPAESIVYEGAIYRVVSARSRDAGADEDE